MKGQSMQTRLIIYSGRVRGRCVAEAEVYAAELSAQEAELDARVTVFTGPPPTRDEAARQRVHHTQLAQAKAFLAWSGARDPKRIAPARLKHETDAQYTRLGPTGPKDQRGRHDGHPQKRGGPDPWEDRHI